MAKYKKKTLPPVSDGRCVKDWVVLPGKEFSTLAIKSTSHAAV